MVTTKLSLLASGFASVSALAFPFSGSLGQKPLAGSVSNFKCDIPPVLNPSSDGLPSAESFFSSFDALKTQVKRHQAIVRVPSVCYDDLGSFDSDKRWAPFYDVQSVLAKTYPNIHKRAKLDKVNTFGLVFTLEGSDQSLKPTLLAAHQDVVPVADVSTWTHPPFDAYYDGEWLWGRGSSDDKNSLTALMSAVETLLSDTDWKPRRTLILAFGFDEECSGYRGAAHIAELLEGRYGKDGIAIILDEGGLGMQQLDDTLYVLPSVMEKGHVDIWFELHVQGGHSSIPFPHTGIGIISEIVTTLEANPYEAKVLKDSPVYNHMVCLACYTPDAASKISKLLKNDDLKGLASELASLHPMTHFGIQTSQSVDMIEGGVKINAMPEVVRLGVNYRVAPQDSILKVQRNVVKYIQDVVQKYDLKLEAFKGDEEYEAFMEEVIPGELKRRYDIDYNGTLVLTTNQRSQVTPVSPTSGPVWDTFSGTIQHTFATKDGRVVPVGEIMTGNTDTRHYLKLSPNIYRWTPSRQRGAENIHTIDERIHMKAHMEIVRFYYDFVRNFDAAEL